MVNDRDVSPQSSHPPAPYSHHDLCTRKDVQDQGLSMDNPCRFCYRIKWVDPGRGNIVPGPVSYVPAYLPSADDVRPDFYLYILHTSNDSYLV